MYIVSFSRSSNACIPPTCFRKAINFLSPQSRCCTILVTEVFVGRMDCVLSRSLLAFCLCHCMLWTIGGGGQLLKRCVLLLNGTRKKKKNEMFYYKTVVFRILVH